MDTYGPPAPPEPPLLNAETRTWTLSRYADVQAALRHPACCLVTEKGEVTLVAGAPDHVQLRETAQTDLDRLASPQAHAMMVETARAVIDRAPRGQTINLVTEVIEPWSTTVFLNMCMEDDDLKEQAADLIHLLLFRRDQDPSWWVRRCCGQSLASRIYNARSQKADAAIGAHIAAGHITFAKQAFLGGTQTLPSFLAKAWLALLQNPGQVSKLRADPKMTGWAVEELLRFAGTVHTLHRLATEDIEIAGVCLAKGDRVDLKLEAANRDPLKFANPERLDISRQPTGNLGVGTGAHACVAAAVVRVAATLIIPVFLASDPCLDPSQPVMWTWDRTVRWPTKVPVKLNTLASNS